MKKPRRNRRIPVVALLVVLAAGLLVIGSYQGSRNEASAVTWTVSIPTPTYTGTIPPVFLAGSFSPADGETEVALYKTVSVQFSPDVDIATLNPSTFYIKKAGSSTKLAASISYDAGTRIATLDPNLPLSPGTTYEVTLTDGIKSTGGLSLLNDQTWSFTTTSWPQVAVGDPAAGATGVPVSQTILVIFDKDMDWSTVTSGSFYLEDSDGWLVDATLHKGADKRTASLDPAADLEPGETYVVTLTTAIKGENGLALQSPVTWSFTTAAGAPQLTAKVPAHEAVDVPVDQVISATFNMDMDGDTITSATFYVKKSGGSPLPADVDYNASTRTATLDPLADLEAGATYVVTLTSAVRSEASASLAGAPVTWTFTTAAGGGPTFPDVPPGHLYYTAMMDLASRGIMSGYEDGRFGPDDAVLRAQFAKMIVNTLGLPVVEADFPNAAVPFTDLGNDDLTKLYPHEYVAVCALHDITRGATATTFSPWSPISRYQVVSMVVRAVDNQLVPPPAGYGAWRGDPDHGQNAARAEYNGLLNGLDLSALSPYDNMSRGEVAQVLHNLILALGL